MLAHAATQGRLVPEAHEKRAWTPSVNLNVKLGDGVTTPLDVEALDVESLVEAALPMIAQHRVTMTFFNAHDRVLEGELMFALPEGATVHGFALDIDGVLVDGVVVPKEKARVTFEAEVRKGVDPGLVEMVAGASNTFKTRVYPLPAKGRRTVRVEFASPATIRPGVGSSLQFSHVLPMAVSPTLKQIHVACVVRGREGATPHSDHSFGAGQFEFVRDGDEYRASCTATFPKRCDATVVLKTDNALTFNCCQWSQPLETGADTMDTKTDGITAEEDSTGSLCHFALADCTFLSGATAVQDGKELHKHDKDQPRRVWLYWDASLSRGTGGRESEIDLVGQLLFMWKHTSIRVTLLRDVPEDGREFVVTDDKSRESLLSTLRTIQYDGATSFSELLFPHVDPVTGDMIQCILLASDGLCNYGDLPQTAVSAIGGPAVGLIETPVHTFGCSSKANHGLLRELSERSGGVYVNLNEVKVEAAVSAIGDFKPQFQFLNAVYNPKQIAEVHPNHPISLSTHNGAVVIAGQLLAESAEITLCYGLSGQVTASHQIRLYRPSAPRKFPGSADPPISIPITQRLWAEKKLADLMVRQDEYKETILSLGKQYGLVSPFTSFIVLDTLEQHFTHDIRPAVSRADMRKQFDERRTTEKQNEATRIQKKWAAVGAMWDKRCEWWRTPIPPVRKPTRTLSPERWELQQLCAGGILRDTIGHGDINSEQGELEIELDGNEPQFLDLQRNESLERKLIEEPIRVVANPDGSLQRAAVTQSALARERRELREPHPDANEHAGINLPWGDPLAEAGALAATAVTTARAANMDAYYSRALHSRKRKVSQSYSPSSPAYSPSSPAYAPSSPSGPTSIPEARYIANEGYRGGGGFRFEVSTPGVDENTPFLPSPIDAKAAADAPTARIGIAVQKWDPTVPYMSVLKETKSEVDAYRTYFKQRDVHWNSPAFYFDCASFFFEHQYIKLGLRILSNVIELALENAQVLRIVGYKLVEMNLLSKALFIFHQVLRVRAEEPQSHRDLALVCSDLLHEDESVEHFLKVLTGKWDARFNEIELTALTELNHSIAEGHATDKGAFLSRLSHASRAQLLPRLSLLVNLPVDLRISLAWDTDMTDVDLHVIEPSGEECFYSHKQTATGGMLSRDFTQGYGPEEYMVRQACPGTYKIRAKYFSSHQQSLTGATTLLVTIWKFYGSSKLEQRQLTTVRLASNKEMLDVGSVTFSPEELGSAHPTP